MDNKNDRRIEKTKESIRKAIIELILEKEYSEITVKELSEKANINRKTFYSHYESIQSIVNEVQEEIIGDLMEVIDKYNYLNTNFDAFILFRSLNEIIYSNYDFYKRIISANSYEFLIVKVKNQLKQRLTDKFKDTLDIGDAKFCLYAEFLASGIMGMYTEWFSMNPQPSIEELADAASKISFGGVHEAVLVNKI